MTVVVIELVEVIGDVEIVEGQGVNMSYRVSRPALVMAYFDRRLLPRNGRLIPAPLAARIAICAA